jgi:N6-adenosine-specific RNA methylase IME4
MSWIVPESLVAVVRRAERTDAQVIEHCKEAMQQSDRSSWDVADDYAELSRRNWSVRRIAGEFGVGKSSVARFLACAEDCPTSGTRPSFWEVFKKCVLKKGAIRGGNSVTNDCPIDPCTVDDLQKLIDARVKCGTILADPPWPYDNQATRAATGNHYGTMTVDEICKMGDTVRRLAADAAHLWLWTTNAFLFACPDIFGAWGFEFKSSYVWCKHQMGIGNYLRNAHEFLLLASRGGLVGAAKDVISWGAFDRTEHSTKPDEIRFKVIEKVSPGPRLELFGRRDVDGWFVWGDQIEHSMFARKIGDHAEREAS